MSFLLSTLRGAAGSRSPASPPPPASPAAKSPLAVLTSSAPVTPERVPEVLAAMKKVPGMLDARSVTLEPLIPPMVRLLASHNAEVKALACEFVVRAAGEPGKGNKPAGEASDPEVGLLALNVLRRDLADPNPDVRITAVSTIASIKVLAEGHAVEAINSALKDSNPKVRRYGVTAVGKLSLHSPGVVRDNNLADALYSHIKDPDPSVVTFAMQTVNKVLQDEGGIVMPNSMTRYLVKRLGDFPNFELCFVLDYIRDYFCQRESSSDEVRLLLLNAMDGYLDTKDGHIFLSAARLFRAAAGSLVDADRDAILSDFAARIRPQVARFMKASAQPTTQEFQVQVLKLVETVEAGHWAAAAAATSVPPPDLGRDLCVRSKDSNSLRRWKVRAAVHLVADEAGAAGVFDYLAKLVGKDPLLREAVVMHLCRLASEHPGLGPRLLDELGSAMKESEAVAPLVLKAVRKFGTSPESEDFPALLDRACRASVRPGMGRKASSDLLWALRAHRRRLRSAPALLDGLVSACPRDLLLSLRQPLAATAACVFAADPPAGQRVLGKVFGLCLEGDEEGAACQEARDRAEFYSMVLQDQRVVNALL